MVRGISGDGTGAGTEVNVLNPWDTNTTFDDNLTEFHPVNVGTMQTYSVDELNRRITSGELTTNTLYQRWKVVFQPAVAPGRTSETPGATVGQGLLVQVVNLYYETDSEIAYEISVISATYSQDASFTGPGQRRLPQRVPDGDHTIIVTPDPTDDVPTDWANFNPAGNPKRVFTEERATVTVVNGRVTAVRDNPHAKVHEGGVVIRASSAVGEGRQPTVAESSHDTSGTGGGSSHRSSPRPPATLPWLQNSTRGVHYVITKGEQPNTTRSRRHHQTGRRCRHTDKSCRTGELAW